MKTNIETAWLRSTVGERQDFVEAFADDLRDFLPAFDDRDSSDNELIGHGQDDGDDEQLDPAELPALIDTNIECSVSDDDGLTAADDEDFREAKRGVDRRAGGKRVPALPSSKDEVERLTKEFLGRGGAIRRVERGLSGLQPPPKRVPAWRKIANKGAA